VSGGGNRRVAAVTVTGLAATVAAVLVVWALPATVRFLPDAPSGFWAMVLLGTLVDIPIYALAVRAGQPTRTTLSACFTFAIFLLYGAEPAIVVQALAGTVAAVTQRYSLRGGAFLTARLVCALAAGELAVVLTEGRPLTRPGPYLTTHDVVGFVLPALVWFVVSFGLLLGARLATYGGGLRQAVAEVQEHVLATTAMLLLVSPLLTVLSGWWVMLVAVPLFALGQLTRLTAQRERRLRRDPVTGLLNRRGLIFGFETLTAEDRLDPLHPRPLAIAVVTLASALEVNNTLGRGIYERLVAAAARRLIREYGEDVVGRLSGEGFVIILPELNGEAAVAAARQAATALTPTIVIDGIPFAPDPAVGVALSPEHGRDLAALVSKAEIAMRQARRLGEDVALYVSWAADVPQRRVALLSELNAALSDPARQRELTVLYQPQVDLDTGQLAGAEALVRWTHPEWGLVDPEELLEAVEPTEVMHLLTRHVLARVVAQVRDWNDRGLRVRVSANVSVRDLRAPRFIEEIRELLETHGVPPTELTIEITERLLLTDAERVVRACEDIVGLGVGLSLDDFGTGYASVQHLRQLPLNQVKIDKSYVRAVGKSRAERAIVTSVYHLARALGLSVVAEGVEDDRTARQLATLPGLIGQGWYFGRPVPPDEFEDHWRQSILGSPAPR
jgi:diguanylate cyclase (GGDEF)-like protein